MKNHTSWVGLDKVWILFGCNAKPPEGSSQAWVPWAAQPHLTPEWDLYSVLSSQEASLQVLGNLNCPFAVHKPHSSPGTTSPYSGEAVWIGMLNTSDLGTGWGLGLRCLELGRGLPREALSSCSFPSATPSLRASEMVCIATPAGVAPRGGHTVQGTPRALLPHSPPVS